MSLLKRIKNLLAPAPTPPARRKATRTARARSGPIHDPDIHWTGADALDQGGVRWWAGGALAVSAATVPALAWLQPVAWAVPAIAMAAWGIGTALLLLTRRMSAPITFMPKTPSGKSTRLGHRIRQPRVPWHLAAAWRLLYIPTALMLAAPTALFYMWTEDLQTALCIALLPTFIMALAATWLWHEPDCTGDEGGLFWWMGRVVDEDNEPYYVDASHLVTPWDLTLTAFGPDALLAAMRAAHLGLDFRLDTRARTVLVTAPEESSPQDVALLSHCFDGLRSTGGDTGAVRRLLDDDRLLRTSHFGRREYSPSGRYLAPYRKVPKLDPLLDHDRARALFAPVLDVPGTYNRTELAGLVDLASVAPRAIEAERIRADTETRIKEVRARHSRSTVTAELERLAEQYAEERAADHLLQEDAS